MNQININLHRIDVVDMKTNDLVTYASDALRAYDGSHDIFHAKKVATNVLKFSKCHIVLSMIAGFLHDTCDSKYVDKETSINDLEIFLNKYWKIEETNDIICAIQNVSYTMLKKRGVPYMISPRSLQIWRNVSDADMIEAMGMTGIIRTLLHQGYKEQNLENAFDYIKFELFGCVDYISNEFAKAEALKRLDTMSLFFSLKDENLEILSHSIMMEGTLKTPFLEVVSKYFENSYFFSSRLALSLWDEISLS